MRVHFLYRHTRDTVIILDEGNLPHPRCPRCYMLVPCKALNRRQVTTAQCAKGAEQNIWRLVEEEMQENKENKDRAFHTYVMPLEIVTLFKYLGRVLMVADKDCTLVLVNLWKAQNSCSRMTRMLVREGANPWVLGMLNKAVV